MTPAPCGVAAFDALRHQPDSVLRELGMWPWGRRVDEHGVNFGPMLWVFPVEWLDAIPEGFVVTTIFFHEVPFKINRTAVDPSDDYLTFGITKA